MKALKAHIKTLARLFGYDIQKNSPLNSSSAQLSALLSEHQVNMVVDIGANIGQFRDFLREAGYTNRIVSFEPGAAAHRQLLRKAATDENWTIASRMAIGAEDGMITLNLSRNSVSSSVLPMLAAHLEAAPESVYDATETVPLRRLDSVIDAYVDEASECNIFIKIDTQGYEGPVLHGARATLARANTLQVEMSLVELYDGQMLFDEMHGLIRSTGFNLWSVRPSFIDESSGRTLQVDALYSRT